VPRLELRVSVKSATGSAAYGHWVSSDIVIVAFDGPPASECAISDTGVRAHVPPSPLELRVAFEVDRTM
jgi:hypothetical protein